jgi:hypothetical protein
MLPPLAIGWIQLSEYPVYRYDALLTEISLQTAMGYFMKRARCSQRISPPCHM